MIPFYLPYHLAFAAENLNFADNYSCAKNRFRQKKALTFVSEISSFFKFYTITNKMETGAVFTLCE